MLGSRKAIFDKTKLDINNELTNSDITNKGKPTIELAYSEMTISNNIESLNEIIDLLDGVTAYDVDGTPLSNENISYISIPNIDTTTNGTYNIFYIAENSKKQKAAAHRIVKVVDPIVNTYSYTGASQTFIPQTSGKYKVEVWGGQGGYRSSSTYGGMGGYSSGIIQLNKGTPVYIYVGGSGNSGGFNGGGLRPGTTYYGGGGGTDMRIGGTTLYHRFIVAGGGGSDGATNKAGGAGGGLNGISRTDSYSGDSNYSGKGGTQTAAGGVGSSRDIVGAFGQGGNGIFVSSGYGGAGGGGWYGGSGTYPDGSGDDDRGGGGGSGYVWTATTSNNVPSGYLVSTGYYLIKATTIDGASVMPNQAGTGTMTGNAGNGYAKITLISSTN